MRFKQAFLLHTFTLLFTSSAISQLQRFHFSEPKMGSPFNIIFYATDSVKATRLATECFSLVDSLNQIYSDYLPGSELNELSNTAGKDSFIKVSPPLFQIIVSAKKAWEISEHGFDITIGSLSQLWRKARKAKTFPSSEEVSTAKSLIGFQYIVIDTLTHAVKILQPGLRLDLGGIAKGDITQKVIDYLKEKGVHHALVDAGGDMVMSAAPPTSQGWKIAVNLPKKGDEYLSKSLKLNNKAVATSGDIYQYIVQDGKRYGHIINPQTGYGVTTQRNVTVIAADGATADWLASACSVLPLSKAKKIARKMNAGLLITYEKDGKIKYVCNKSFSRYWY